MLTSPCDSHSERSKISSHESELNGMDLRSDHLDYGIQESEIRYESSVAFLQTVYLRADKIMEV